MYIFKDINGVEWDVQITMETALRLRKWDFSAVYPGPVSLYQLSEDLLKELTENAGLVMAIVYAICKPMVDQRFVDTPEDTTPGEPSPREMRFLKGINGQAIEDAKTALFNAIADFFPTKRTAVLAALEQPRQAEARMQTLLEQKAPEMAALMNQKGEELVNRLVQKLQTMKVEDFLTNGAGDSTNGNHS